MANSVAQAQKSPGIYNPRGNRILRKGVAGPSIRNKHKINLKNLMIVGENNENGRKEKRAYPQNKLCCR